MKIEDFFQAIGDGSRLEDLVFVLRGDLGDHDQQIDQLHRRGSLGQFDLSLDLPEDRLQIVQLVVGDQQVCLLDRLMLGFGVDLPTVDRVNFHSSFPEHDDQKPPIFEGLVALDSAEAGDGLNRSDLSQLLAVLAEDCSQNQLTTGIEEIPGHLPIAGLEDVKGDDLTRKQDQIRQGKQGAGPRGVIPGKTEIVFRFVEGKFQSSPFKTQRYQCKI